MPPHRLSRFVHVLFLATAIDAVHPPLFTRHGAAIAVGLNLGR